MYTMNTISIKGRFCEKSATIYKNPDATSRACILYFHGGGLLYGSRCDLPEAHLEQFTSAGFPVIAFDYPLAPACDVKNILQDVIDSVNTYLTEPDLFQITAPGADPLPYVLLGRSSGAYLTLLAAASMGKHDFSMPDDMPVLKKAPVGVLSYYGYGFLEDRSFFSTMIGKNTFYYTILCAHSTGDTDVPFTEFQKLTEKYHAKRFIASGSQHDFDRDTSSAQTKELLKETINFLNTIL